MTFWALILVLALVTLDAAAVELVLPHLSMALDADIGITSLVVTAYFYALTLALLPAGVLADRWGAGRVFKSGCWVFLLGSLACSFAPTIEWLVAGRVVQGLGAGMTSGSGPALIFGLVPAEDRDKAFGKMGMSIALGYLVGPSLGGIIFEYVDWRWLFLVNLPLMSLTLWLGSTKQVADHMAPSQVSSEDLSQHPIDYLGLLCSSVLVSGLFVIFQNEFLNLRGWLHWIILLIVMAASVHGLWRVNTKLSYPAIDLNLWWYNKAYALLCAGTFCSYAGAYVIAIAAPFYVTSVLSLSSLSMGLLLTTFPLGFLLGSPLGGWLSSKLSPDHALIVSQLSVLAAALGMLTLSGNSTVVHIGLATFLIGISRGSYIAPAQSHAMSLVTVRQIGQAGAVLALIRNLGMMAGTLCAAMILASFLEDRALQDVRVEAAADLFATFSHLFAVSAGWALISLMLLAAPVLHKKLSKPQQVSGDPGF